MSCCQQWKGALMLDMGGTEAAAQPCLIYCGSDGEFRFAMTGNAPIKFCPWCGDPKQELDDQRTIEAAPDAGRSVADDPEFLRAQWWMVKRVEQLENALDEAIINLLKASRNRGESLIQGDDRPDGIYVWMPKHTKQEGD